jgi:Transposase IS66 family.
MLQGFQQQLDTLLRKIEQLEGVVHRQQKTIDAQQRTIEAQQKRIKQLESELAAAKKNSTNSSKPPSSDIVKPKKDKTQNQDGSTQKKRGGQQGHDARFRKPFAEDQIDEVIEHTLTHCPSCGTELQASDRAPCVVQQVKLIEKPIKIEEHRGVPYWCPTCQCIHYGPMPEEVEHGGLFDAKLSEKLKLQTETRFCHGKH